MSRIRRFAAIIAVLSLALLGSVSTSTAANAGGSFCAPGQIGTELFAEATGGYGIYGAGFHVSVIQIDLAVTAAWHGTKPTATVAGAKIMTVEVFTNSVVTGSPLPVITFTRTASGTLTPSYKFNAATTSLEAIYVCGRTLAATG